MEEYVDKSMEKPNNYLVWSIVTTFLCCWPFSVPAIVYAVNMNSLWAAGRYEEANAAAEKSKRWSIISAIAGFTFWIIYAICAFCIVFFTSYLD